MYKVSLLVPSCWIAQNYTRTFRAKTKRFIPGCFASIGFGRFGLRCRAGPGSGGCWAILPRPWCLPIVVPVRSRSRLCRLPIRLRLQLRRLSLRCPKLLRSLPQLWLRLRLRLLNIPEISSFLSRCPSISNSSLLDVPFHFSVWFYDRIRISQALMQHQKLSKNEAIQWQCNSLILPFYSFLYW